MEALSDKVSVWMTLNEAAALIGGEYMIGVYAPFESSPADDTQSLQRLCRLTKMFFWHTVKR